MFWIFSVFAVALAVLHAARTGDLFDEQNWPERIARVSMTLTLVFLAVGTIERARIGSPFLWFHWLILTAVVSGTISHGYLMWASRRDAQRRRRVLDLAAEEIADWLAEVDRFDPCANPDCQQIRGEMRTLGEQLRRF